MARKTREESLAIKHRILDAAELVLLERGVAQTAMADLAEAAGMSRGAVYGHYKNKMEVCLAMCDRAFARTSEGFEASDGQSALDTLRRAASHYLEQCGEPGSMQRVLVILYTKCEHSEENLALQRRRIALELQMLRIAKALLRRAVAGGEVAADLDVHLAAVYLVSLLEGVFESIVWTNRLRRNLWSDAEAILDAGFDAVRTSTALRRRAQKLPE
ncbi:TetR family transcriptional regulator [Burkholderia stagnalis]|uniref:TetR family transcriptional regulator n=1 Tax=Burkholderia stagnalis TaxID=1503054 RepID=A0A3N7U6Z2_9BURK|nr:TetR family transcriptional regulator [Burkholderia stagnalis]AOK52710.1 TetR family transcriptional regulator [Burkholderia stagnalis]KAB0633279.1 TetR family transcriptional regulator [Burkholderia stagnalis]KVL84337.1 TetR family transcriptional regulator [Burkholderia stagnalis]KVL98557.1 TetR family transcriptional regulator [Burkholderia stagnalis]KVM16848.1 TetR family transcriptional regulator [Burkholderia stagnalis]